MESPQGMAGIKQSLCREDMDNVSC